MDLEIVGRSIGRVRNRGRYQLRSGAAHSKYERAFDEQRPLVCLDETTKQLVKETRLSLAAKPGHPQYIDYEYERAGVATLFMLCAPLLGCREVRVTESKTGIDYAHCLKYLAETVFAQADKVVLV